MINFFLVIVLLPGVFVGLPLLDALCFLELIQQLCIRDRGSGNSTGEEIFVLVGAVLFYVTILLIVIFVFHRCRKFCPNGTAGFAGYNRKQHEKKEARKLHIRTLLEAKGQISNGDVQKVLKISDSTVALYMQELEDEGIVEQVGKHGRSVRYRLNKLK